MSTITSTSAPAFGTGLRQQSTALLRSAWAGMQGLRNAIPLGWPRRASDTEREAAEVRALADSYRESDPGFAGDLHAAVDRYEAQRDAGLSMPSR